MNYSIIIIVIIILAFYYLNDNTKHYETYILDDQQDNQQHDNQQHEQQHEQQHDNQQQDEQQDGEQQDDQQYGEQQDDQQQDVQHHEQKEVVLHYYDKYFRIDNNMISIVDSISDATPVTLQSMDYGQYYGMFIIIDDKYLIHNEDFNYELTHIAPGFDISLQKYTNDYYYFFDNNIYFT